MRKKLFSLLVLLMVAVTGAWAETTIVTWTSSGSYENNNSRGGVTLSGEVVEHIWDDLSGGEWRLAYDTEQGTFTTSLGNFTSIVISGGDIDGFSGTGWDGRTWTGNASSVPFRGYLTDAYGEEPWTITFTIASAAPEPEPQPAGYAVSLKAETADEGNWTAKAGEGDYQSLPLEGVAEGTQVTLTYSGLKKVKSVKAVKKAAAPAEEPVTLTTALTIEAITAGTITVSNPKEGMKYSTDGGKTKTAMTATTEIPVQAGQKVQFYGTASSSYGTNIKGSGEGFQCKAYGNIMSLISETDFATATTLTEDYALSRLFNGNTTLTDASGLLLPAMTLSRSCYSAMFLGCSNLTAAPELPAEIMVQACYMQMFMNCTKLETAPELKSEQLAQSCYSSMFYNCSSLTTAPVLPAKTLPGYCYSQMFQKCSKLGSVTCLATDISADACTNGWLTNAGTEATDPKLYVDASMTEAAWNNGIFTVTVAASAPAGNPLPTTSSISGYMGGAFAWDGDGSPTSDFSMNLFNAGDKISLLSENNANVQLTTSEGGAEATFSGTAVDGEPTYYAVYPYTDGLALSGTTITGIVIPSIQWNHKWYDENNSAWDPNAPVAYATTTGSSFQFSNLCAILKIKVVGSSDHSDAGKITISADQALAGTFSLDTSTGTLTATEGSTTVDTGDTWDAGHWVYFENNYCYFAIAPGTYSNFKVRTDIWGDLKEEKTKASVTFEKGKIYDLGEFSCK